MCVLYLNGFSNASGRVFVAQEQPHSQFNSSGVAQSALLGTSGCYSSRKPGWLCVIAEWNTAFQVHNRPRLDYCPRILCKFSLLPLWWWRAVKSELTTQLWCFNVKKLKNPRRTSDLLLFAVKLHFLFSCWIFYSNNHRKSSRLLGFLSTCTDYLMAEA